MFRVVCFGMRCLLMKWRKSFWFCTLSASFLLSDGGCAWPQSLQSPPFNRTAQTISLVRDDGQSGHEVEILTAAPAPAGNATLPLPVEPGVSAAATQPGTS